MAECLSCHQEMTSHTGCLVLEYEISGAAWSRIPNLEQQHGCHDCGAPWGELHHPGCDSEWCPKCGGQLISCECAGEPDGGDL